MKRYLLSLGLCLAATASLSAAGAPAELRTIDRDSLITVREDDLIEVLRELSRGESTESLSNDQLMRYYLLLQLLQGDASAVRHTTIVAPQQTAQDLRLDRLENMLMRLNLQLGHLDPTQQQQQLIVRRNQAQKAVESKPSNKKAKRAGREQRVETTPVTQPSFPSLANSLTTDAPAVLPVVAPAPMRVDTVTVVKEEVRTVVVPGADAFARSVYFAQGAAALETSSEATLLEAVAYLKQNSTARLSLRGYASPEGKRDLNMQLANKRRDVVARYLEAQGIASDRLALHEVAVDGETKDLRLGRRVDLVLHDAEMDKLIYDYQATTNTGQALPLSNYRGRVMLIVNTASKCGLTPQYAGLERLHKQYESQGLSILAFPCDQFGGQELDTDKEIAEFCQLNYGLSFPLMKKVDVNGEEADPIFKYLRKQSGAWFSNDIKWNFTKFLISRDGKLIKRYSPRTTPEEIAQDIEELLAE